ncbi:MAG TPA: hypothetical protein VGR66_00705 [Candidatus Eisenbacteria bacterium]|jgi:hypothetical protein|nr:hypothetical protein [Candidatus Eisenbacteria bacterium]
MRAWSTTWIVAAALALALFVPALVAPAPAHAAPAIDWDPVEFYSAIPGQITPNNSPAGAQLIGVGTVSTFGPPFAFLNANIPAYEYSIYVYGLISAGTTSSGPPAFTFYNTNYVGGFIEIHEDTSPDANFAPNPPNAAVPSTFQDGTIILSGSFTSFFTQTDNFSAHGVGNAEGDIVWTGGTLLPLTNDPAGKPCLGLFTGGLVSDPAAVTPGFIWRHDGKIDLNCPTAAQTQTWGAMKGMYR